MFKKAFYITLCCLITSKLYQCQEVSSETVPTPEALKLRTQNDEEHCKCLNDGECIYVDVQKPVPVSSEVNVEETTTSTENQNNNPTLSTTSTIKELYCRCTAEYIGIFCQNKANKLIKEQTTIQEKLTINEYNFFYYEPKEENIYAFYFKVCLDDFTIGRSRNDKILENKITFFFQIENETGYFEGDDEKVLSVTTTFTEEQLCKTIYVHYTTLGATKFETVQKLILGMKLGKSISNRGQVQLIIETTEDLVPSSAYNQVEFEVYSGVDSIFNEGSSGSEEEKATPQKDPINPIFPDDRWEGDRPTNIFEKDEEFLARRVFLEMIVNPFLVEDLIFNILFTLTTVIAVVIVFGLAYLIRSRLLGIRIRRFRIGSRLINNLTHFDRYMPEEKFGDLSFHKEASSENALDEPELECSICLNGYQANHYVRRLPCNHMFHKNCIDTWCEEYLTCPMCRRSLTLKKLIESQHERGTQLEMKNSPENLENADLDQPNE